MRRPFGPIRGPGIRSRGALIRLAAALSMIGLLAGFSDAAAQVPSRQAGEPAAVTAAELIYRLQQSGLSQAEVRSRLQQAGQDPGLADPYFEAMREGGRIPVGQPSPDLLEALAAMGVGIRGERTDTVPEGSIPARDTAAVDSLGRPVDEPEGLPVFGRDLFSRSTSQFQPVTTGPVDPGYRVGPGDQLSLILSGDVEAAHTLEVTREGFIVLPDVGQVHVNGLTIRELEDRLYGRLGSVYSGIGRGVSASTHFQVSLGQLRANQVFVIGEVERPGSYQVSSVATVFNALYLARGPNRNGSFREVQVRRGGQIIRTVDIYDYLLAGDSRDDIRLEQGDAIFVPVIGTQVGIDGAVRRRALFEMQPDEDLRDLLRFAGRPEAGALLRRVQIDRILPPDERRPGVDRVLVDVDLERLAIGGAGAEFVRLQDGDFVQVFSISLERRNRITLTGEVNRPGVYEWRPGATVWDVIERADGLSEQAYTPRAHIYRLNPEDGSRTMIRTPLLGDETGRRLQDVTLADRDSVVIYSRAELGNPETVEIDGYVKNPGTYSLATGMTVRDLILAAGGFVEGANELVANVARRPAGATRTQITAHNYQVLLREDGDALADPTGPPWIIGVAGADAPAWQPEGGEFELRHGDHVFVRKAPGFEAPQQIVIDGEVMIPGRYVLQTRQERLTDALARAGGLTGEAYAAGLRLLREGNLVATDLPRAMGNPGSRFNLVLEPGDSIVVPQYDPTVLVTGAVAFETRVLYDPDRGLDYYVNRAGGYSDVADPNRVSIAYQDGERASTRRIMFHRSTPEPGPGSTIFVPEKPAASRGGVEWDQVISRTLSIATTLVTLLVAADRL